MMGRRLLLVLGVLIVVNAVSDNCAYAQNQFGYKSFSISTGYPRVKYTDEYILRDGVITHKYYVNDVYQNTTTYRCNPNVEGQDVLEVFTGIRKTKEMFHILKNISYEDGESNATFQIKKGMECCEEAIKAYKTGGCESRSSDLEDMYEKLEKIRKSVYFNDLIRDLKDLLRKYRSLDTEMPCGYVY